ncbi:hypothetical protein DFH06DRAFT_602914 [Mycena polygramma]|nr:hypothetical protein DFH06DRAFT_602914 [Mycena polygramma]
MHPGPPLPTELEREIFETTALMHPLMIPVLLRVARRVFIWIEPLLYRAVVLKEATDPTRVFFNSTKPAEFFHSTVRHLAVRPSVHSTAAEARQLLHLCKGTVDLIWCITLPYHPLLPILAQMRVQRLGADLRNLFGGPIDPKHFFFASLTHLHLFESDRTAMQQIRGQISGLPALTHLCVSSQADRDDLLAMLAQCPRLGLLLVLWGSFQRSIYRRFQTPCVYDVRFVICQLEERDYWANWEAGARGFSDLWSQGDDFVARKRRGEIEATCYWLN